CCSNCKFYDASANEWCREPMARSEKPRDPQQGNTCEYFLFFDSASSDSEREKEAKAKLSGLFGESVEDKSEEKADWMDFKKPDSRDIFGQ
ncbi:MAG: hypothetical protein JXR97_07335, partial [Planctomycetes bacterium]|nr:hypothetical protein [Planctomycetota bacterium]